jgi:hypothetical protein
MPNQDQPWSESTGLSRGPFSEYLTPPKPVFNSPTPDQAPTSKGGGIAFLANSLLGGLAKGRMQADQKTYQEKQNQFMAISDQMDQIQRSGLPDDVKQQQIAQLGQMRGQLFLHALGGDGSDQKKSKSKKGGDQSSGSGATADDQQGPGVHIRNALHGIVSGMLGPGAAASPLDPKQIQDALGQSSLLLQNAPQIEQQHNQQVAQGLQGIVSSMNKPVGQITSADLFSNPQWAAFYAKNQGNPSVQQFATTISQQDKQKDPLYQAQLKEQEALANYHDREGRVPYKSSKDGSIYTFDGTGFRDIAGNKVTDPEVIKSLDINRISTPQKPSQVKLLKTPTGYSIFDPSNPNTPSRPLLDTTGKQTKAETNFWEKLYQQKTEWDAGELEKLKGKVADKEAEFASRRVAANAIKEKKQREKALADIDNDEKRALKNLSGNETGEVQTTPPPKRGANGNNAPAGGNMTDEQFLNSPFVKGFLGGSSGTKASPATKAPPKDPKDAKIDKYSQP